MRNYKEENIRCRQNKKKLEVYIPVELARMFITKIDIPYSKWIRQKIEDFVKTN